MKGTIFVLDRGRSDFGLLRWLDDKRSLLPMQKTLIGSLGQNDPLEEEMTIQPSILAWRPPWTEPGGLQSVGSQRVGHDLAQHRQGLKEIVLFLLGYKYFSLVVAPATIIM